MAAIDQINVNIGTEQSPNYVLHDVNDKRISSTAVTTATHLLATDASLSAINPITASNLASVLGALKFIGDINDCNSLAAPGVYTLGADTQNAPFRYGIVVSFDSNGNLNNQIKVAFNASSGHTIGVLFGDGDWAFFDKVS